MNMLHQIESLKAQRDYCLHALSHDLENWERKEYHQVKMSCDVKINELAQQIDVMNSLYGEGNW